MVHCGVHHFEVARYVVIAKFGNVTQRFLAIVVFVTLDVAFIFEINAIFVSKIIPIGVVAIVTVAHVVDVTALHQHHFLLHLLTRDSVSAFGVCFVAVHTLHLDGFAIEIIVTSSLAKFVVLRSGLFDFNLAETNDGRECLEHIILGIHQFTHQHITPRGFCTPFLHKRTSLQFHTCSNFVSFAHFHRGSFCTHTCYGSSAFAIEFFFKKAIAHTQTFEVFRREIVQRSFDVERSIHQRSIKVGDCHHIAHLHFGFRHQTYVAEDTRQAEHILALQERTIIVAIYLYGKHVLTFHQIGRDVKRSQVARVLRETHIFSVDVKIEERVYPIEVEIYFTTLPILRKSESATIRTHFVAVLIGEPIFAGFTHHTLFPVAHSHLVLENHTLVTINRHTILLCAVFLNTHDVPVHRHLHLVPTAHIVVGFVEVYGTLFGISHPVETPFSVQTLIKRRGFGQHLKGFLLIGKREKPSVRTLFVECHLSWILPFSAERSFHLKVVGESWHVVTGSRCRLR